jgi:ribonuclease P protein component
VLSVRHRLRRPADFSEVLRGGSRAGREALVVHLLLDDGETGGDTRPAPAPSPPPARIGFVVPRAVGNAVVRNHVTRRLRALSAARIERLGQVSAGFPPGCRVVIRALPTAADASYATLSTQLDAALATALRRAGARAAS